MALISDMGIKQLGSTVNAIAEVATGKKQIAVTDTSSFVSVAQTAYKTGYDNLMGALSQVMGRSIFSIRPYTRKFRGIYVSEQRWGNMVRKIQMCDKDWSENDERYMLTDGNAVDMYKVNIPKVLQTNFYGWCTFSRHYTIFKDQLDAAFRSPSEFAQFLTMVVTNCSDIIEQTHENLARSVIQNFIGGKILGDGANVLHVLTIYNEETGQALDSTTLFAPQNFKSFIQWLSAFVQTVSDLMTERSYKYHINITGKEVTRHTPKQFQKVYLLSKFMNQIKSMALSDIYHDTFVTYTDNESVGYWQSIDTPDTIDVTPVYLKPDGTVAKGEEVKEKVLGVVFDRDALGITTGSTWSGATPFNVAGGYSNMYFHFTERFWNDFTENAVILMLD